MRVKIKHPLFKYFIFIFLTFGFNLNSFAQEVRRNNFFMDIKSIDLSIGIDGDYNICGLRESDVRSSVGYTLSNSPLRRIDKDSGDTLSVSMIAINDRTESGRSLGCSVAINIELWRFVNFKGRNNLVTVWSRTYIQGGRENQMGGLVNAIVERATKEFIVKWAEQN